MIQFLKRLFCRHKIWNERPGVRPINVPPSLEKRYYCKRCGKRETRYISTQTKNY